MKVMRYALTALLCYAAFWGAAHVGMLPLLRTDPKVDASPQAMPGAEAARQVRRYLPVIR
ncbi:hypothetical protein [Sphingobium sp. TCM1]|uniref:hypothetical protein n=1 Tax=Sphingobium sp. TCM1 TaxID=453246 RepID=UPI0007F440BE|nr:hypothetical protein [Sphingobium sp. TCM1]OAN51884.1 hypothetical protein A7Q26_09330 [Sphingobium sp. TCM1]